MKLPHRAHCSRRWQLFCFFAFSILFIITGQQSPAAAQAAPAVSQKITLEKGKTTRWELILNNKCLKPHRFGVKSSVKYIRFDEPTSVLLAPAAGHVFGALIDATKLKSGVYKTIVFWDCPDCKKEDKCSKKERNEIPIDIIVTEAQKQAPTYTLSELVSRFSNIVKDTLKDADAELDEEASKLVDQMINQGAAVIIDQKAFDLVNEADGNLKKFCQRAVEYAEKEANKKPMSAMSFAAVVPAKTKVTGAVIKQVRKDVCPMFPFC